MHVSIFFKTMIFWHQKYIGMTHFRKVTKVFKKVWKDEKIEIFWLLTQSVKKSDKIWNCQKWDMGIWRSGRHDFLIFWRFSDTWYLGTFWGHFFDFLGVKNHKTRSVTSCCTKSGPSSIPDHVIYTRNVFYMFRRGVWDHFLGGFGGIEQEGPPIPQSLQKGNLFMGASKVDKDFEAKTLKFIGSQMGRWV